MNVQLKKPEVVYMLPCAEVRKGDEPNTLLVTNPLIDVNLDNLPNNASFFILIGFHGVDTTREHSLTIKLFSGSKSGKLIRVAQTGIPNNLPNNDPYSNRNIVLASAPVAVNTLLMNVKIENEGKYVAVVYEDEEELGSCFFYVTTTK